MAPKNWNKIIQELISETMAVYEFGSCGHSVSYQKTQTEYMMSHKTLEQDMASEA